MCQGAPGGPRPGGRGGTQSIWVGQRSSGCAMVQIWPHFVMKYGAAACKEVTVSEGPRAHGRHGDRHPGSLLSQAVPSCASRRSWTVTSRGDRASG